MDQKELRHNFIRYLQTHYDYARPEIMASNVFYAWHNNIGIDFWEIFKTEDSIRKARDLLIKKFEEAGRKNPKGHAAVHYGCWEKFREFLLAEQEEAIGYAQAVAPVLSENGTVFEAAADSETELDLASIMDALRMKRKLFHSEADFQFALAWEIQTQYPEADVRLEYCPAAAPNMHIDILVKLNGRAYPIELKYKTLGINATVDAETYHLKSHGAQDIGKYDCLLDLQRIEVCQAALPNFGGGFVIWMTNDPSYWTSLKRTGTMAEAFDLSDGAIKSGAMCWAPHTGAGTSKNRTEPIQLAGAYTIRWREYSKLTDGRGGQIRYVLLDVKRQKSEEHDG